MTRRPAAGRPNRDHALDPQSVGRWTDFHEGGRHQEKIGCMTENLGEWPFKRGPITKSVPSDGRGWEAVSLAVEW